ncbi:hypothetical protein [Deinococcus aerophilus]|uniref:DNA-binding protein n=1 Tax=Deinococcus aerophilus TaxID=522488 RepID=A0ABQ2H110_9DEIO|nr:hypothetical protein [Deinococcus aerophilus]GGM21871.1 hypothetical protein GCM10010841_32180 [Deinococcus aerophilus]
MTNAPLMLTPRQAAERLGIGLGTLRKHAATWEALAGEPLPRGEHLERLWPESVVTLLGEALVAVHCREAASVEGALGALYRPAAPLSIPPLDVSETLRQFIRDEVRAVIREEIGVILTALSSTPTTMANTDAVRLAVREELNILLVRPGALESAARQAPEAPVGAERDKSTPVGPAAPSRPSGGPALRPRFAGRSGALLTHLENGCELVSGGGMFRVMLAGQVVQSYAPSVARRVLEVPGLLRQIGPDRWALA